MIQPKVEDTTMSDYLTLAIGAPRRLAILKRAADKLNAGHNARKAAGDTRPYTWRDVRYSGFHNARAARCELSPGLNDGRPIWYAHTGQQFPRERYADEIWPTGHTGWFTDCDGRETARGLVVALPHGRFLAGYHWSDNGERVYFSDIYDCEEDAARAADSEAERFAEASRENDSAWRAGERWADLHAENSGLRKKAMALIADIKKQTLSGPICDALREKLNDWRDTIRDNKNAMARLADGYEGDLIFWPGDKTLASAFNDGAGRSVIREAN